MGVLVVVFTVLIWMFVWVARFMARSENTSTDAEVKEMDGQKRSDETHLLKERGYGANYGLTLGVVSCVLFLCGLHRSFGLWQQWVCSTVRATCCEAYTTLASWPGAL